MNKIDETLTLRQHHKQECNIENRTIFCHDNLQILQGINNECIDLIYLDPPFNKKKTFTAPVGTSAEGASFKDIFYKEDLKDEWLRTIQEDYYAIYRLLEAVKDIEGRKSYNFCYLAYMAIRLIEMHRVLKDTGSIYLHCDPTMSHYLKILLDCIFGEKHLRNEIVWHYPNRFSRRGSFFSWMNDTIFFYSKSNKYIFNNIAAKPSIRTQSAYNRGWDNPSDAFLVYDEEKAKDKIIEYEAKGKKIKYVNPKHVNMSNVWTDINIINSQAKERTGYPTQKPLTLLERIINASSKKGDIILDPFCGCATTCVAAEKLERYWIGIDISIKAYELVQQRIKSEVYDQILLKGKDVQSEYDAVKAPDIHFFTSPPKRTDSGVYSVDAKYVYVISHPHYENEYKVGIASNWKSRLNAYQTSDPERSFRMEYKIRVSNYRKLEDYIHTTFPNKHEWVHGDLQEIIKEIEQNAITQGEDGELFNESS